MGKGIEDFWKCTFCPSFVWCSFDSYSCGVPSVPYLYAAPLLLCPVFSYLLFLFISLLLLLWITNMLLLWYLIYIFLLFYCCHFMLHLCFSFYLYASNFCRGPHLLCSWFMYFFLWNFVLEHCSLSPHFITMKTFKNYLNVFFFILYKPKWVTFENKTYIQMVSYLYNIQIIMKIDIWCYSKHTKK